MPFQIIPPEAQKMKTSLPSCKHSWHTPLRSLLALAAATQASAALAVNNLPGGPAVRQLDMHPAVTKIAEQQQWLHWVVMGICLVIFIAVFGVMFYSILKHRKSVGHKPANFHESLGVEIAWTIIPFIIVIGMGAMATRTVVAMKDTSNADRRSSTGVVRLDDVVRRNRSMNGMRSRSIMAVSTSVLFLKCQYTAPRV